MKLVLYHKRNYIFDKTDDDLITVSIKFNNNIRNNFKNNFVLCNFFKYYLKKIITNVNDIFITVDCKYINSFVSIIFSKENIIGFEKIIKYIFTIYGDYTEIYEKYIESIEKIQYNSSFIFIENILYEIE